MMFLLLSIGVLLLSVVFRLAALLRLSIPLAYALIAPTLFHGWFSTHQALGECIGYALFVLVVLSWVVSLARNVYKIIDERRADKAALELFQYRVRKERERTGENAVTVSTEGLYR